MNETYSELFRTLAFRCQLTVYLFNHCHNPRWNVDGKWL